MAAEAMTEVASRERTDRRPHRDGRELSKRGGDFVYRLPQNRSGSKRIVDSTGGRLDLSYEEFIDNLRSFVDALREDGDNEESEIGKAIFHDIADHLEVILDREAAGV